MLYGGENDPQAPRDSLAAWQTLTLGDVSLRQFPGGHFYLQTQTAALVQDITHQLSRYLDCAPGNPTATNPV
jgi:surfactin synthase thioesterase subunit